jgi:hypothetical protein
LHLCGQKLNKQYTSCTLSKQPFPCADSAAIAAAAAAAATPLTVAVYSKVSTTNTVTQLVYWNNAATTAQPGPYTFRITDNGRTQVVGSNNVVIWERVSPV